MEILTKKEEKINITEIIIVTVKDSFKEKKIIARIQGLVRPVYLWKGEEEYIEAGNWTNETALARAEEVLSLPEIPWAF
jgi:hypothetical protein